MLLSICSRTALGAVTATHHLRAGAAGARRNLVHTVIANTSEGAWPVTTLIEEHLGT
jgi:hypothetical protein